jgi:Ca2+:H+ antiporter
MRRLFEALRHVGWLNVLLVFVPVALLLHARHAPATWVFAASALGIVPLAGLMGHATEALAARLGSGLGGLLNASFGNAAELIIAIVALKAGMIDVVKASLTGSILGNILLVLGASFLAGGMKYPRQTFNATAAGLSATLLALAAVGLLVPAFFHAHVVIHHVTADELGVSTEIAVVLFAVYVLMLLFSLRTHRHLYEGRPKNSAADPHAPTLPAAHGDRPAEAAPGGHADHWSPRTAVVVLLLATLGVTFMSETLVGAIEETREAFGWSAMFVGVIVVAVVGNAAEHSTAILVALKDDMELAFQIAVGSALQIALFVAPVLVFVSHLPGFPQLDLVFGMLEVTAVTISVLIVGLVAYDGESNWLEGLMLLAVYVILAIAFFHLPETPREPTAPRLEAAP